MSIEIASGSTPKTPLTATAAKPAASPSTPAAGKPAASGDQVVLSPQAQALATLQAMNAPKTAATAAVKTDAEKQAEAKFREVVKKFFSDGLGIDHKTVGGMEINDEALRYVVRNTVLGALAPPGLRKDLGIDLANRAPKSTGKLAEVTLSPKDHGSPLARVAFDGDALEELARLPRKNKDKDGDRMFTALDLMPNTRTLKSGEAIRNGQRFVEADTRFAKADGPGVHRVTLSDDTPRPYFLARLRKDVGNPGVATPQLGFSLLQFAGFAP